jgi:cell division protease FtsH
MTDQPKKTRNKPLKKGPSGRFQPNALIWILIIFMIFSLFLFNEKPGVSQAEWSISQVLSEAKSGHIAKATIKSDPTGGANWNEIRGELLPEFVENGMPQFIARGRLTDDNLERLQATGVFTELPASTLMTELLLTVLPFVIIIGVLYFLFMRQMKMAGRGAMSFGKSKAKMLTRERERSTFADVAGCDEAKEEVQEVVEFLKDPKKFQKVGGRIPKGCLLVGPPGTGKTLLARAIAGEADVPFFSISGSDFVEMFVGVGAARVRDMFEQGRKSAPCIIFIDEIDAVGRQRGAGLGGGNDEREQTLNSLLVEMDGFDAQEGVIIVAATNRPDVLDSALLRPGRFDRQILIDLPDLLGREAILKVHAKKIQVAENLDLAVVARSTAGFSGADLANLLNEGALLAARYGKDKVDANDVDEAKDKISFGRERRRLMDDEDKKITAYHEAGHAVVQSLIDDGRLPLHKVTIIPRGQALGMAMMVPAKDILHQSKGFLLNRICCAMGGRVAEELIFNEVTSGASSDIKQATRIARHMVCDWGMSSLGPVAFGENQDHIFLGREISRTQNYSEETAHEIDKQIRLIVDAEFARAKDLLTQHFDSFEKVAQLLLKHETIEGKHVEEIIKYGEMRSPIVLQQQTKPQPTPEASAEKSQADEEPLGPETAPAMA